MKYKHVAVTVLLPAVMVRGISGLNRGKSEVEGHNGRLHYGGARIHLTTAKA